MKRAIATGMVAVSLTGCAKVQQAIESISGIKPNIVGKVTSTETLILASKSARSTEKTIPIFGQKLPVVSQSASGAGVSGCSVEARSIATGAVIATGTSGSDGTYVIESDSIQSGEAYRVVATCGTKKFAAVISADVGDPDSKRANPASTNARTTLIAAQIVKAVLQAVESATVGVSDSVKEAIKAAVLAAVNTIISQVSAVIEDAIDSGAMSEPSDDTASTMTDAIADAAAADDVDAAETAYTTGGGSIPESVSSATSGASSAVSALPACDVSLNTDGVVTADQDKCTRAIAKLMYSLGFTVAVNTSASYATFQCTEASMGTDFPGAAFEDLGTPPTRGGDDRPTITGGCLVRSNMGRVNRNDGYEDRGGNDGGTMFVENFPVDGARPAITGTLSKVAAAMLAKYEYTLENIDQIAFSHNDAAAAGLNMRLVFGESSFEQGQFKERIHYLNQNQEWASFPACVDGQPCASHMFGNDGFDTIRWSSINTSSAGGDADLITELQALGAGLEAGDFVAKGVMRRQFAGPVPTQTDLDAFVNQRAFVRNNPTGEREFQVLLNKQPRWNNPGDQIVGHPLASCADTDSSTPCPNGCFDNDSTTTCYASDNSVVVPIRVNVVLKSKVAGSAGKGITPIQSVTEPDGATGEYFLRPVHGPKGFLGVLQFINASTGKLMRDDQMRPRAIFIKDADLTCPSGLTCSNGSVYNVGMEWSCGGQSCEVSLSAVMDATAATPETVAGTAITKAFTVSTQTEYRSRWENFSGDPGHSLLVVGQANDWRDLRLLKVSLDSSDGAVTDAEAVSSTGNLSGGHALAAHWACSEGGPCSVDGFYAVDENGVPYENSGASARWSDYEVCVPTASGMDCDGRNVVKYTPTALGQLGSVDFDPTQDGIQSFAQAVASVRISSGPVPNPSFKCSFEPYFVETGTPNGRLDCNESDSAAGSGDVSFSNEWEFHHWKTYGAGVGDAENAGLELKKNENGYRFGNPMAVKKLLSTAFPGWFDGKHEITTSTRFNALQSLSLVFLFFEGSGEGGLDIGDLRPEGLQGGFISESPIFRPSASAQMDPVMGFNRYFGNGFTAFKQATF